MNCVYIKRNVPGHYVVLASELNAAQFDNIGHTWQDYLDNKWVLLSKKQVAFHEAHPEASLREVWDMELTPAPQYVRSLEDAKRQKLAEIDSYDSSDAVNVFTVGGIPTWLTVQERLNRQRSVDAAKLKGVERLSFFVDDTEMEVATAEAEKMLATIQLYADECFLVTKRHKLAVESLESIEEVDAYDFTVGYPQSPVFEL